MQEGLLFRRRQGFLIFASKTLAGSHFRLLLRDLALDLIRASGFVRLALSAYGRSGV
jgi:hypothetical protein